LIKTPPPRRASAAADKSLRPVQKGGVNSVEVASAVLRALAEAPEPARLSDLARATGMPTAKTHRYLVSLVRGGLVEQDPESSRYDLGPLALRAGIVALSRSDALKRAERSLQSIVERTGETAAAAIWGTHGPTVVRLVEARHEQASIVPLGHVCSLTFSAAGLVFCAFGSAEQTAKIANREMAQSRAAGRSNAPTRKTELDHLVTAVRKQGFACVAIEGEGGMSAVSVPVFDSSRAKLQLALSVFGGAGRINITPDGPIVKLMTEAAQALGAELHAPASGKET
jgi:DNA-binding IclR family transcriptional regulator